MMPTDKATVFPHERSSLQEPDLLPESRLKKWRKLKLGMIGFAISFIILMWIAAISYFQYATQRQIEYTYRTNENLAAAYAAHTAQALKEIEGLLRVISREHRRSGQRFDLPAFAQEIRLNANFILALYIVDASGNVVQASQSNFRNKNYADREHFRVHVENISDQLYSGKPVMGRNTQTDVIPFSLRISGPRDEFMEPCWPGSIPCISSICIKRPISAARRRSAFSAWTVLYAHA